MIKVYILTRTKKGYVIVEGNIKEEEKNKKYIKITLGSETKHFKRKKVFDTLQEAKNEGERRTKQIFKNCENKICRYCGKKLNSMKECTIDHIVPKSYCRKKNKSWEYLWRFSNIALSCERCNLNKGKTNYHKFIGIEKKSHYLRKKTSRKNNKLSSILNHRIDNVLEIAKKDSRYYNIKMFFCKQKINI